MDSLTTTLLLQPQGLNPHPCTFEIYSKHYVYSISLYIKIQRQVWIPKCLGNLWQGPKQFDVLSALRESNIPVTEFDTHWSEKVKSLRTDEDKRTFIKMLKEGGVGGGNLGGHKIKRQKKVWLVKRIVGRDTSTTSPGTTNDTMITRVCVCVCVCVYV